MLSFTALSPRPSTLPCRHSIPKNLYDPTMHRADATAILNAQRPPEMTEAGARGLEGWGLGLTFWGVSGLSAWQALFGTRLSHYE